VKLVLLLSLLSIVMVFSACTTLENRRDLYFPQSVEGPYTRMLKKGIPKPKPAPAPVEVEATTSSRDFKSVR
jgi:hypothetical protein